MTQEVQSRPARIRQFLNAGIALAEQATRLADPKNGITEDEIWVLIFKDMMTRVSPMVWIGDGGQVEFYAYNIDSDTRSRQKVASVQQIVSQFLMDEGGDNEAACRALRADLEAALDLLPPTV